MVNDITQVTGEGQLSDGSWCPPVLTATGAVAELGRHREGNRPEWTERGRGCVVCAWHAELGQCHLCRAWVCSDHRTLSYSPQQPEPRRGGVDCQCEDWRACRVRTKLERLDE